MSSSKKLEIYHAAYHEAECHKEIEIHGKTIEELNAFLIPRIDTILKYKKVRRLSINGDERTEIIKERRKAVIFYDDVKNYVPPELLGELMSYWDSIGKDFLTTVSINKDRERWAGSKNEPTIRYVLSEKNHGTTLFSERHFLQYNGNLTTVSKISNSLSDLVKEVYNGKLDNLQYYIQIRPYTGW